jgi:undecaprenyl diphosphate synthase
MAQRSGQDAPPARGLHAAIIMDGNGRWAQARGRSRPAGHLAGADAVRRTVEAAPDCGVEVLTLYAFSSDNWRRPLDEVGALMRLLRRYLMAETGRCVENGVRIQVIGRRDRLAASLVRGIEAAEAATAGGRRLLLRIAVDYSARDAILHAAERYFSADGTAATAAATAPGTTPLAATAPAPAPLAVTSAPAAPAAGEPARQRRAITRQDLSALLAGVAGERGGDVDLLIRTGGEKRLSDFMLWECAYAELIFTDRMWPDFGVADLQEAVAEFHRRERRFGTVPAAASARPAVAGSSGGGGGVAAVAMQAAPHGHG